MVCSLDGWNIRKPLDSLVCEYRKRAAFGDPCIVIEAFLRHRLFDHDYAVLLKPIYLVKSFLTVFPALVCVNGQRQVSHFAYGPDHLLVIVESDLDLQYIEAVCAFAGLFAYYIRGVYAYGEGRVRSL